MGIMPKPLKEKRSPGYVEIDEDQCTGCVLCMKACPTKAIRVKDGRVARIEGVCIDCGECVRTCTKGAIKAASPKRDGFTASSDLVISPSTVLYSQFGEDYLPNDILLGLKRMGFGYVHDQSYTSEMCNFAVELFIKENRKKPDSPFPLISPACPVVVRLISYRFPSLLKHIPPLATPREIVAREAKKRLSAKYGCSPEEIGVLHITPCPALADFAKESVSQERYPRKDKAVGINSIYETLKKNIQEIDDDRVLHHSSGIGIGWGMSGGEIAGMKRNCLAVSGLDETIRYLEKIEMGLLQEVDYIECRICAEGCLGGPFTVADKYQARHLLQKLVLMFGVERRIKYKYVIKLYKDGWFFTERDRTAFKDVASPLSISDRIERLNRVEETLRSLPRKECGVCGSPDCRAFAEDVVDGKTTLKDCIFFHNQKGKIASRAGR